MSERKEATYPFSTEGVKDILTSFSYDKTKTVTTPKPADHNGTSAASAQPQSQEPQTGKADASGFDEVSRPTKQSQARNPVPSPAPAPLTFSTPKSTRPPNTPGQYDFDLGSPLVEIAGPLPSPSTTKLFEQFNSPPKSQLPSFSTPDIVKHFYGGKLPSGAGHSPNPAKDRIQTPPDLHLNTPPHKFNDEMGSQQGPSKKRRTGTSEPLPSAASLADSVSSALAAVAMQTGQRQQGGSSPAQHHSHGHTPPSPDQSFPSRKNLMQKFDHSGSATGDMGEDSGKRCNCKRSRCIKLYCECFAAAALCAPSCNCQWCLNTADHMDKVMEARRTRISVNPTIFEPGKTTHQRGCHCKTGCMKKYCLCFQAGQGCSMSCQCVNCANTLPQKPHTPSEMPTMMSGPPESMHSMSQMHGRSLLEPEMPHGITSADAQQTMSSMENLTNVLNSHTQGFLTPGRTTRRSGHDSESYQDLSKRVSDALERLNSQAVLFEGAREDVRAKANIVHNNIQHRIEEILHFLISSERYDSHLGDAEIAMCMSQSFASLKYYLVLFARMLSEQNRSRKLSKNMGLQELLGPQASQMEDPMMSPRTQQLGKEGRDLLGLVERWRLAIMAKFTVHTL